ncbi:serine carboxypeptidase S28-domain-containing protein [Aspergillus crustosus]
MRFSILCSTAAAVLLANPVAGLGMRSDLAKKLQLNAELGLNSNLLLKDYQAFRTISTQAKVPVESVSLPIDHENPSLGTYQNRFWANDDYYRPGGPVFLYDAGETDAGSSSSHLVSNTSFFRAMMQEFNAIGIVWEHRYYGQSLPYPVTNNTTPEHLKYLTTRQALADIPSFARNFTRHGYPGIDLTPASTPWVMVGGSYPGIRAALARSEYPDTIYASFASSAPLQAQIDMSSYYTQVHRGMIANGAENCAKDIHAALQYIDEQLSHPKTAAALKQLFFGEGAENNSNEDFTAALGGIFGFFQTYGMEGGEGSLRDFCDHLATNSTTGLSAGPNGLAPLVGNKYLAERWAAWPVFVELVNLNFYTNCRGLDSSAALSCELNNPPTTPSAIAWTWQYCSEWGFYQSSNTGVHSLLSKYQTLEFQQLQCNRLFPEALQSGILPPEPQAVAHNTEYGGWTIRPSNVFFTSGEFDPWRTLTLLSKEEWAPQGITVTSEIPQCGVRTAANTVFGYVGANEYHCFDFRADSAAGAEAREYFRRALKEWLPCFAKEKLKLKLGMAA